MALPVHPGWNKPTAMGGNAVEALPLAKRINLEGRYRRGEGTRSLARAYAVPEGDVRDWLRARGVLRASAPNLPMGEPEAVIVRPLTTTRERIARWTAAVNAAPSPVMDAKQAEIDRRNAEDAARGGSAFSDGWPVNAPAAAPSTAP